MLLLYLKCITLENKNENRELVFTLLFVHYKYFYTSWCKVNIEIKNRNTAEWGKKTDSKHTLANYNINQTKHTLNLPE